MQLRIGLPHIKNIGLKSRLEADIELPNGEVKTLYYEVESQYEKYLCTDRSDAFLISLLQYAMFYGYNITWDCPVTERLFYQLNTMYIPVLAQVANDQFHSIKMEGALVNTDIEKSTHCVATGASGGIDSFYTVMRHLTDVEESYRLTHLFYVAISNNVTSLGNLRKEFENGYKFIDKIAKELKLPIVTLFSNEAEFYYNGIVNGGALRYAGMVYALEKLFSIYYLSSGFSFADMKIKKGDSHYYDLFNLFCVSTKSIQFYSTGGEKGRHEKTSYIENFNVVKKYLHVCNFDDVHNCSICDKCFRTMLALYADGVLEDFQDVFDLEKFHKYKIKYMARMVYRKSVYDNEIIKKFKVNNKEIPVRAKIKGIAIRPIYLMWQKLQKNKFFMKLFYKTKLDYVLYSKEMADSIRYCNDIK
ncbi:MAG: hypothetical protein LBS02_03570 [Hungatella sp.]|nr:hypothetical protein [Hungatella sp.]